MHLPEPQVSTTTLTRVIFTSIVNISNYQISTISFIRNKIKPDLINQLITRLIVIDIAQLTVLFCNCPLDDL